MSCQERDTPCIELLIVNFYCAMCGRFDVDRNNRAGDRLLARLSTEAPQVKEEDISSQSCIDADGGKWWTSAHFHVLGFLAQAGERRNVEFPR